MYRCANCGAHFCERGVESEALPAGCPMRGEEVNRAIMAEYGRAEVRTFFAVSAEVEAAGYCKWPRLRETVELCKRMGWRRIGMAFCSGLCREAREIAGILERNGLEVISVICKNGGVSKEKAGIPEEHKLEPGSFEAMCNPIGQAMLLNEQGTQFNIVVGLCVGHDSLFYKYSGALSTTLIAKDRVLAHNPAGAVYCAESYFESRLTPDQK